MKLEPKRMIIGGLLILAVLALFFIVRPNDSKDDKTTTPAPPVTTGTTGDALTGPVKKKPKPTPPPIPKVIVKDGEPQGGELELEFNEGEMIRFEVKSDVDEEIHVHGYDESKEVKAGETAKLSFKADISGIFEVELENSAVPIASLQVSP